MAERLLLAVAGFALLTSSVAGCTTVQQKTAYYRGNTPDLRPQNVAAFAADQEALIASFQSLAGTGTLQNGDDWRPVVHAGMHYVDVRCSRFMDALFWLNRARDTSSNQIRYAGAGASALLALLNASRELIGIAPIGFGFLDQTVNNVGQGLLYNLDPGIVSGLVSRQQAAYRGAIKDTQYTTRGAALQAVQQYAALCLPVSIEGEVNRAIADSEFEAVTYRPPVPPTDGRDDPTDVPPPPLPASENVNVIPVIQQRSDD